MQPARLTEGFGHPGRLRRAAVALRMARCSHARGGALSRESARPTTVTEKYPALPAPPAPPLHHPAARPRARGARPCVVGCNPNSETVSTWKPFAVFGVGVLPYPRSPAPPQALARTHTLRVSESSTRCTIALSTEPLAPLLMGVITRAGLVPTSPMPTIGRPCDGHGWAQPHTAHPHDRLARPVINPANRSL